MCVRQIEVTLLLGLICSSISTGRFRHSACDWYERLLTWRGAHTVLTLPELLKQILVLLSLSELLNMKPV
jgi:hypothetical protein